MLRPRRITPCEIFITLQMIQKPNSIIVNYYSFKIIRWEKFIFDSVCLSASLGDKRLFSSVHILQIADVVRRVVFLLFLLCF